MRETYLYKTESKGYQSCINARFCGGRCCRHLVSQTGNRDEHEWNESAAYAGLTISRQFSLSRLTGPRFFESRQKGSILLPLGLPRLFRQGDRIVTGQLP